MLCKPLGQFRAFDTGQVQPDPKQLDRLGSCDQSQHRGLGEGALQDQGGGDMAYGLHGGFLCVVSNR